MNMKKLEIGSGNRPLDGYEHLDINPDAPHVEYVSGMDKVPTEDGIFDEVKAIHVLEHAQWRDSLKILKEWVRVLKPGGKVHIAVPNFRWIVQCYHEAQGNINHNWEQDMKVMSPQETVHLKIGDEPLALLWANFKIMSSGIQWDQHYACFDADLLSRLLAEAGCKRVKVLHDGDSLMMEGWK